MVATAEQEGGGRCFPVLPLYGSAELGGLLASEVYTIHVIRGRGTASVYT